MFGLFKKLFSTSYDRLTAGQVIAKLNSGWQPFIIDVRSHSEAKNSGVVKGLDLQHPHSSIMKARKDFPKKGDILVYCASGMRSGVAIRTLIQNGVDPERLTDMKGGFNGYARSGGQTQKWR